MPREIAYKIVGSVLKWGSWISVIVLILGILLFLIVGIFLALSQV